MSTNLPEFTDLNQFLGTAGSDVSLSQAPEAVAARRDAAKARYGDAEQRLAELLETLYVTIDSSQRGKLLRAMRDQATVQGEHHLEAFGPTPVGPTLVGINDMTGSLAMTAILLNCLAGVESARAGEAGRQIVNHPAAQLIEQHTGGVLDRMSDPTTSVDDLHTLMEKDLYDAVVAVVGETAAEVLVTIADTVPQSDGKGGLLTALAAAPQQQAPGWVMVALATVAGMLAGLAYLSGHQLIASLILITAALGIGLTTLAGRVVRR